MPKGNEVVLVGDCNHSPRVQLHNNCNIRTEPRSRHRLSSLVAVFHSWQPSNSVCKIEDSSSANFHDKRAPCNLVWSTCRLLTLGMGKRNFSMLATLAPSFVLNLSSMRCGYASEIVPTVFFSPMSCRKTCMMTGLGLRRSITTFAECFLDTSMQISALHQYSMAAEHCTVTQLSPRPCRRMKL